MKRVLDLGSLQQKIDKLISNVILIYIKCLNDLVWPMVDASL